MNRDDLKVCTQCSAELPMTEEFFVRDAASPDGFRNQCKHCRALARSVDEDQRNKLLAQSMNEAVLRLVTQDGIPQNKEIPHYTEIYSVISDMLGGARGIAAHIVGQYLAAKDGSQTKTKLLVEMLRMAYKASDDELNKKPDEYKMDAEIEEELRRIRYEIEPAIGKQVESTMN